MASTASQAASRTSVMPFARVGQHVGRVRQQRKRVRREAGHHLAHHEHEDQRRGRGQPAPVRVGGRLMPVPRMPVVLVCHVIQLTQLRIT
jgi:hypothetical protein